MKFIDLEKQQKLIRSKIDDRIKSVLDSGNYIMGDQISELEEKLARYVGVKYSLSCSSGKLKKEVYSSDKNKEFSSHPAFQKLKDFF